MSEKPSISEKINVTSNLIVTMSGEPAERLGIAVALVEIYRHDLQKTFADVPVPTKAESTPAPEEPKAEAPVAP